MENNFGKDMARRNVRRYRKLKYLVEFLYKKSSLKINLVLAVVI